MDVVTEPSTPTQPDESERAAFATVVRPHWDAMARLARRLAPGGQWEDVLQDALTSAWRKRAQFDEARGTARSRLLAIVADQAYKGHRRLRLLRNERLRDEPLVEARDDDRDRTGGLDLAAVLRRLSPRQQTAIALHYYLGLPLAEIATVMGCSTGTVKSTLADARGRLRRELGEDYR